MRWIKLLLLIAAFGVALPASAETVPATSQPWIAEPMRCWTNNSMNSSCSASGYIIGTTIHGTCVQINGTSSTSTETQTGAHGETGACRNAAASFLANVWKQCQPGATHYVGASPISETQCFRSGTSYTCPSTGGWTVSGSNCVRAECALGVSRDANGACISNCAASAGTTAQTGKFNIGASASGSPGAPCYGGCMATFTGSLTNTSLVNGVVNYWVTGSYNYVSGGASCTAGTDSIAGVAAVADVPPNACATGQVLGTFQNKPMCIKAADSTVAAVLTPLNGTASSSTVTTNNVTNNTTTYTTTTTAADGVQNVSVTTFDTTTKAPVSSTLTGPGAWPISTTSGGSGGASDGMAAFCAANPQAEVCKVISSGNGAAVSGLYTAETNGKTFASSVNTFKATVTGSAFYTAAGGFFSASGITGTCSGLATSFTLINQTIAIDLSPYLCGSTAQTMLLYLGAGLLLAFTAAAFAIALL